MSYKNDTPELKHYAWLCLNLNKQVRTPLGDGLLRQAFSTRLAVVLDNDPKKLKFFTNLFDVVPFAEKPVV